MFCQKKFLEHVHTLHHSVSFICAPRRIFLQLITLFSQVRNRHSTVPAQSQGYKSMSSLPPTTLQETHKAWEHNFNVNNGTATAQVIGVFEPTAGLYSLFFDNCRCHSIYA